MRAARRAFPRLTLLALSLALAACEGKGAPTQTGVCWRAVERGSGAAAFEAVSGGVDSLDDCAALLETYHLRGARAANGAFQGYFIFIDDREVASSPRADGFRYPIFQPSQRREIDADLLRLIKDREGRMPSANDIAVERK